jgi:hypothetical protein
VQYPTVSQDSSGQPIVTWANFLVEEPAKHTPISGLEVFHGMQMVANAKAIFTVRYRTGYTDQMRIVHNGEYFGIIFINKVDGRNRFLELTTSNA